MSRVTEHGRTCVPIPRAGQPAEAISTRRSRTFRSITLDCREIEFSEGFTDLHRLSYREILAGRGFMLDCVRPSIEAVSGPIELNKDEQHPFLLRVLGDNGRYQHGWPV